MVLAQALSTGRGLPWALGLALQPGHRLLQVLHDEVHLGPGCYYGHAQPDGVPGPCGRDAQLSTGGGCGREPVSPQDSAPCCQGGGAGGPWCLLTDSHRPLPGRGLQPRGLRARFSGDARPLLRLGLACCTHGGLRPWSVACGLPRPAFLE